MKIVSLREHDLTYYYSLIKNQEKQDSGLVPRAECVHGYGCAPQHVMSQSGWCSDIRLETFSAML